MKIKTQKSNLWDHTEAILRGKFVANIFIRKEDRSQINDLNFSLKKLEEQIRPKVSGRKK